METEKKSSDEECIEQLVPPVPSCDDVFSYLDTDNGVPFKTTDVDFAKKDMEVIPVHALTHSFMTVLNIPKQPPKIFARLRRALQCFASVNPSCAVSLFQIEALLFPAIFFKQLDDGTYPGALPFFLYCDKTSCCKVWFRGFAATFYQ